MGDDGFSFEELSRQDSSERKSPKLTKLGKDFWHRLWDYRDNLETVYLKQHAEDPASRKTVLLGDELRNAARKSESLWEARQRKIAVHAMKNARQGTDEAPENLAPSESSFYRDLVRLFQGYHDRVLTPRAKDEEQGPAAEPPKPEPEPAPIQSEQPVPPDEPPPAAGKEDIATVRALDDIPPFVGIDGQTYRLKKGEVATIPKKMADILRKRKKIALVT